jgi:hypothetical protein
MIIYLAIGRLGGTPIPRHPCRPAQKPKVEATTSNPRSLDFLGVLFVANIEHLPNSGWAWHFQHTYMRQRPAKSCYRWANHEFAQVPLDPLRRGLTRTGASPRGRPKSIKTKARLAGVPGRLSAATPHPVGHEGRQSVRHRPHLGEMEGACARQKDSLVEVITTDADEVVRKSM